MVEGHSVHRVAHRFRQKMVGSKYSAWSPNCRFAGGASAIDGKMLSRIEAVGKNLFAFFGEGDDESVVVHIHFGMAGNWAIYDKSSDDNEVPEPSPTNRLRLESSRYVADLSAMTVQHGGMDLYKTKRSKLGEDPLRDDADPDRLWDRVSQSAKSIGALIMDQSFFTGPGNIYRAEILFKAGIHPDLPGKELSRCEFDTIWRHTVDLLQRGFETGSILTVDPIEANALGKPRMRRYIYNTSKCPRCETRIQTWQINNRTCYACPTCQPFSRPESTLQSRNAAVVTPDRKSCKPFISHCAPVPVSERLKSVGPMQLTIQEIKSELARINVKIPHNALKKDLVERLQNALSQVSPEAPLSAKVVKTAEEAAMEKALAGESLAVEHIAELAPMQARKVRSKAKRALDFTAKAASADSLGASDFSSMTSARIKEELFRRGIAFRARDRKSALENLLTCAIAEEEKQGNQKQQPARKQRVHVPARKKRRLG